VVNLAGIGHWLRAVASYLWHPVKEVERLFEEMPTLYHWLTFLIGLAGFFYIVREVGQSWILLARSLPRHGRKPRSVQALSILGSLIPRLPQLPSFYAAAQLRIELELLNPLEPRPLHLDHRNNRKAYHAALSEWKTKEDSWTQDTNARLSELVREEPNKRAIDVGDCSALIENPDVEKYFDALTRSRFGRSRQPVFLSKVAFKTGFLAPMHLVTGVLARYEEDWGPVIDAFGRAVVNPDDDFRYSAARELQLFIFDCWLMWGPSIPICTCPEWHGEVALQYGFGDEDNSLILRCPSPQVLRLLDEDNPSYLDGGESASSDESAEAASARTPEKSPIARRARVTGTLKWGPSLRQSAICPAQQAIWTDKRLVVDITGGTPADSIRVAGGTEDQVFALYYSAYLWIAFVMCESEDNDPDNDEPFNREEKWRDLIPFFMHANIANRDTYGSYCEQLAQSALQGALQVLIDQKDSTLVLRFACAIDESGCGYQLLYAPPTDTTIRQRMVVLADKLRAHGDEETRSALDRLRIGDEVDPSAPFMQGDYSACALPEIITKYFEEMEDTPDCHELRWSDEQDRKLLKRFYKDCLVPEIPDRNARDSLRHIQGNLRRKEKRNYAKKNNNYHVVVLLDGDDLIGGAIADYLFEPNAGVIEYFIIQPDHREKGVGRRLLEFTERLLHEDADRMRRMHGVDASGKIAKVDADQHSMHETVKRHNALDWIVAELPDPYLTPVSTNQFDPFVRAQIWARWGFGVLDFPYEQPALDKRRRPVSNLLLMAKPSESSRFEISLRDRDSSDPNRDRSLQILGSDVHSVVETYFKVEIPDTPDSEVQEKRITKLLKRDSPANLISFHEYLGVEKGLHISEVLSSGDPVLAEVEGVYAMLFAKHPIQADADELQEAFQPGGLNHLANYRYHLWGLRDAVDTDCMGMASFVTMPTAGFSNCIGFVGSAGSPKLLEQLIARIEEQMMRDRKPDGDELSYEPKLRRRLAIGIKKQVKQQMVRLRLMSEVSTDTPRGGWYIECPDETTRDVLVQLYSRRGPASKAGIRSGFSEIHVDYRRPLSGGRDQPQGGNVPLLYKPFGRVYKDEVPPSIAKEKFLKAITEIYSSVYGIDEAGQGDGGAYRDLLKSLKLDGENIRFKPPGSETAKARHQLHGIEPTHAAQ
jgi:GNAT superfamily N-acetyltransferase